MYFGGGFIPLGHFAYRPFRNMLTEVYQRYRRPLFIAETGAEGSARAAWLHYVASETAAAQHQGIPVEGLCIYPILDYPGGMMSAIVKRAYSAFLGAPTSVMQIKIWPPNSGGSSLFYRGLTDMEGGCSGVQPEIDRFSRNFLKGEVGDTLQGLEHIKMIERQH